MTRAATLRVLLVAALVGALPAPFARSQSDARAVVGSGNEPGPERDVAPLRDPFWPIGWRPPHLGRKDSANEVRSEQARWNEALSQLKVTGLTRGRDGAYLAVIKDAGIVEKGDVVSVSYKALVYKWRIAEITSSGIVPEPLGVSKE